MLERIFKAADKKTIEQRREICNGCDAKQENKVVGATCGTFLIPTFSPKEKRTCGCIIKEKTQLKKEHCPRRKW